MGRMGRSSGFPHHRVSARNTAQLLPSGLQSRQKEVRTPMQTRIPFLDLITPHVELEEELLNVVRASLTTGCFVGGPILGEFESAFAGFCQTQFCTGVASGTDAL